jgi:hypothetical protein
MFLIRNYKSYDEETGDPLYWSNIEDGWVDYSSATWFTEEQTRQYGLPAEGIWEQNSAIVVFNVGYPIIVEIFDERDICLSDLESLWADTVPCANPVEDQLTGEETVRLALSRFGIKHYRIIRYNQIGG